MALNDLLTETANLHSLSVDETETTFAGAPNSDITRSACEALSGNWLIAVTGFFLFVMLIACVSIFSTALSLCVMQLFSAESIGFGVIMPVAIMLTNVVSLLLQGVYSVGFCAFFHAVAVEQEARVEYFFSGFRRFGVAFLAMLFCSLVISLGTVFFIIPGIIASYRYAMVYFVIADEGDVGPVEAMSRSKDMMVGNKWKFFCLQFRFVGWFILSMFSFGLGVFWLVPYMMTSFACFYEDVK